MTQTSKIRSFLGLVWIITGVPFFIATYWASHSIVYGIISVAVAYFVMFIGMIIAIMDAKDKLRGKDVTEQMQKKVREIVMQERKLCGRASVNMSKAVADRVANRIAAKYISGMDKDKTRDSILGDIGKIVEEEVGILQKVVEDESIFAGKNDEGC